MHQRKLYSTGLDTRRDVLGREYVDSGLAAADDFMMAFQDAVTNSLGVIHGVALASTGEVDSSSR